LIDKHLYFRIQIKEFKDPRAVEDPLERAEISKPNISNWPNSSSIWEWSLKIQ
jgi:hypothetical protein